MYYRLVSNYSAVIRCVSAIAEKAIVAQKRLLSWFINCLLQVVVSSRSGC